MTQPTTSDGAEGVVIVRRALLSLSDKSRLPLLAGDLHERGVELVSTGGTADAIEASGLPVTRVEAVTRSPEMLGGRVKTLHPAVHAAILADTAEPAHREDLDAQGIEPLDLVVVDLYPFERAARTPGISHAELVEQIDIGGVALLRAAAKNHARVAVAMSDGIPELLDELAGHGGGTTLGFRARAAARAFARTSAYDAEIAGSLGAAGGAGPPPTIIVRASSGLRYGENPQQAAHAARSSSADPLSVLDAEQLHGKALSYNNLLDASAALKAAVDASLAAGGRPAAAVVKHTNPCGLASAGTLGSALAHAARGDERAAYGGIVAVTTPIDLAAARLLLESFAFLEVVVAPRFDDDALAALAERRTNLRLLATGASHDRLPEAVELRSVLGGVLVQERDTAPVVPAGWRHAAGPTPSPDLLAAAALAVVAAKHSTSNAIAIASPEADAAHLVGAGAGQVDRVTACRLAAEKAGHRAQGAAAASDAFFPFPDGPEHLIEAGVGMIVHPGGSKRDGETFALCDERAVTCLTTAVRHFRH